MMALAPPRRRLMGLALSAVVYAGVLRGLQPLKRLEAQIERAGALPQAGTTPLPPIELTSAPQEVHSLASTINRLLETVARGQQKEKRFLNDAAHQLRTPLAGLISQVELAQRQTSEAGVAERLSKVRTGAERSAHLVHQLLTLARTETQARREPLDLATLAREVAREWTPRALAAGMDLGYEGEDHLTIQGDALQLREALSNLIDNALRYTPRGSSITLRVSQGSDGAHLAVDDNGPGLNPDDMAHVFQRFWRGSQQPGGCGLGLAIVQEIARRHGGEATVTQLQPQGLRIQLRLV